MNFIKVIVCNILILLYQLLASYSYGQSINAYIPSKINKEERYLFYLHGKIIEDQGIHAVSPIFGQYDYRGILDSLKKHGFNVISEARPQNTNESEYALKVSKQIDTLIRKGVLPQKIFVLGASKGAFITLWVAALAKNKELNFIVLGTCSAETTLELKDIKNNLCGNFLSIYETSDTYAGSCNDLFSNLQCSPSFKEISLSMNKKHGFLFKPYDEWLLPIVAWANKIKEVDDTK